MAWTDIRGQPLAVRMLTAHLQHGRLASAYLFVGPEGVGKRFSAMELAKALNCERETNTPCDQCGSCRRIRRGVHPDLHLLIPQGASATIGIDEVRGVLGRIALRPFMGPFSIVILDEADRLTEEAANSLLKALEEPQGNTRFLLITAKPFQCPPTILSRCQAIRFQQLSASLIEEILIREQTCDPQVAGLISRLAQGSLSKASELARQWDVYRTMVEQLSSEQPTRWLEWHVPTDRQELSRWLACAVFWLRDLVVASMDCEPLMVRLGSPSRPESFDRRSGLSPELSRRAEQAPPKAGRVEGLISHLDSVPAIRRQAQRVDRQRCMDVAMQLIELGESLERFASPRLVGTLMREKWLELLRGQSVQ